MQPIMNETPCQHGNRACPLCDAPAPAAAKPVTTELRKTAWVVSDDNGDYITVDGHMYLSDAIAREIGRETGNVPVRARGTSLKTVVVAR